MQARDDIYIEAVGNGWIVKPPIATGGVIARSDTLVFGTMDHLIKFIEKHFKPQDTTK